MEALQLQFFVAYFFFPELPLVPLVPLVPFVAVGVGVGLLRVGVALGLVAVGVAPGVPEVPEDPEVPADFFDIQKDLTKRERKSTAYKYIYMKLPSFLKFFSMPKDINEVSKILLYADNKILLLQKPNKRWQLPGGHLKEGESPEQGLRREVKEETGLTDYKAKLVKTFNKNYLYSSKVENTKIKLSSEHISYKWLTPLEASKLNLTNDTEEYLRYA